MSRGFRICSAKGGKESLRLRIGPANVDPFFMGKKITLGGIEKKNIAKGTTEFII